MIQQQINDQVLTPALDLLPRRMDTPAARVMLLAIGLQESQLVHRRQIVGGRPVGPAKGLWQFERDGGCLGVLGHRMSVDLMRWVCLARKVPASRAKLWNALPGDDVLAAAAARLLLWTDPSPLPAPSDRDGAWDLYLRVWRPGKPRPQTWAEHHAAAVDALALDLLP